MTFRLSFNLKYVPKVCQTGGKMYFYLLGKMYANIKVVLHASILYHDSQSTLKISAIKYAFNKYSAFRIKFWTQTDKIKM